MRVFVSDMDGTLLDGSGRVSERSAALLGGLLRQGLRFTVATARTPLSALPLLRPLPLTEPMILMNGALLYDPAARRFSHPVVFGGEGMEALRRAEEETGVRGMLFSLEDGALRLCQGAVGPLWEGYFDLSAVRDVEAIPRQLERCAAAELVESPVVYALYMEPEPERLGRMYELLRRCGALTLDYYRDKYTENRWCLEISSVRAGKGRAVETLRGRYDGAVLTAFGDGENDIPLFRACDEGYAVENACGALKRLARGVIPDNNHDGVAVFLKEWWEKR